MENVFKIWGMRNPTIERMVVLCCYTSGFDKGHVHFHCRTIKYYQKESHLARKKS